MQFRLFRILRALSRSWGLLVFWLYVGLFLLTFAMIFVFPPGALAMIFLALAGLLVAVPTHHVLRWMRHALARRLLRGGTCPACAGRVAPETPGHAWTCPLCATDFGPRGVEMELGMA